MNLKPTVRTVTAFLNLQPSDFEVTWGSLFQSNIDTKISDCVALLRSVEDELITAGYTVQTLRIATNPFGEWMIDNENALPTSTSENGNNGNNSKSTGDENGLKKTKKRGSKLDMYKPFAKKAKTTVSTISPLNRLDRLDQLLTQHQITFCSVGPARTPREAKFCIDIVKKSGKFSCSYIVDAGDAAAAKVAADTIITISKLGDAPSSTKVETPAPATPMISSIMGNNNDHIKDGLGNFRFCAACSVKPNIPFFPAAKAASLLTPETDIVKDEASGTIPFAVGLENGPVAQELLKEVKSVQNIKSELGTKLATILMPIQNLCEKTAKKYSSKAKEDGGSSSSIANYLGMDTSFNPSLDPTNGSIAAAMEKLDEVPTFGGPGTLGAAAEITKSLQSVPNLKLTGYCGLMLPVCEDTRLAELANIVSGVDNAASSRTLRITDLLSISSVCGVGIDTVPIPGDVTKESLSSLILDVAGIAGRWDKSLSCRVFPVPGKKAGEMTEFDSPYMVNSKIFSVS